MRSYGQTPVSLSHNDWGKHYQLVDEGRSKSSQTDTVNDIRTS